MKASKNMGLVPHFPGIKYLPGKPCVPYGILSSMIQEQREVFRDDMTKHLFLTACARSSWKHVLGKSKLARPGGEDIRTKCNGKISSSRCWPKPND